MFKIQGDPTIPANVIIVGQGKEQTLELVYHRIPLSRYSEMLAKLGEGALAPSDAVLELVESWKADAPLNAESLGLLREHQPGAEAAIITAYGDALRVARKGN